MDPSPGRPCRSDLVLVVDGVVEDALPARERALQERGARERAARDTATADALRLYLQDARPATAPRVDVRL